MAVFSDYEFNHSGMLKITGDIECSGFSKLEDYKLEEMRTGNTINKWRLEERDGLELPKFLQYNFGSSSDCYVFLNPEDKSYVSIKLELCGWILAFENLNFSLILSVEGSNTIHDFSQSVEFSYDKISAKEDELIGLLPGYFPIHFDRYIKRKKLLEETSLYIRQDTLKLKCFIVIYYYVNIYHDPLRWAEEKNYIICSLRGYSFLSSLSSDYERDYKLNLMSAIYAKLCDESEFFRAMARTNMKETISGLMEISDDILAFSDMLYFTEYGTISHIYHRKRAEMVLELATKYLYPRMIQACQEILEKLPTSVPRQNSLLSYGYSYNEVITEGLQGILWNLANGYADKTRRDIFTYSNGDLKISCERKTTNLPLKVIYEHFRNSYMKFCNLKRSSDVFEYYQ